MKLPEYEQRIFYRHPRGTYQTAHYLGLGPDGTVRIKREHGAQEFTPLDTFHWMPFDRPKSN